MRASGITLEGCFIDMEYLVRNEAGHDIRSPRRSSSSRARRLTAREMLLRRIGWQNVNSPLPHQLDLAIALPLVTSVTISTE
jgi:hypothetical protein